MLARVAPRGSTPSPSACGWGNGHATVTQYTVADTRRSPARPLKARPTLLYCSPALSRPRAEPGSCSPSCARARVLARPCTAILESWVAVVPYPWKQTPQPRNCTECERVAIPEAARTALRETDTRQEKASEPAPCHGSTRARARAGRPSCAAPPRHSPRPKAPCCRTPACAHKRRKHPSASCSVLTLVLVTLDSSLWTWTLVALEGLGGKSTIVVSKRARCRHLWI